MTNGNCIAAEKIKVFVGKYLDGDIDHLSELSTDFY